MKCMQNVMIVFILTVLALLGVGLVTVFSATCEKSGSEFMTRQAGFISVGIAIAVFMSFIPMKWFIRVSSYMLALAGIMLLYLAVASVLYRVDKELMSFMVGVRQIKGTFQWIEVPVIGRVQPSEFAKFSILLFLCAYYGVRGKRQIRKWTEGFLIPFSCIGLIVALVFIGGDTGTGMIMSVLAGSIMFYAGVSWKHLLCAVGFGLILVSLMVVVSPERLSRLTSFGKASELRSGDGYQVFRAQMALGGGGMTGRGFTHSIIKTGYLSEHHTDFILAVWGEEMGLVGMLAVLLLYMALMVELIIGAVYSHETMGVLLCLGLCTLVTTQAIVNIGVVTGALPTTGITAPFISYGGSSIVSLLMCIGLVANVFVTTLKTLNAAGGNGTMLPSHEEMRHVADDRMIENR